ncbi:MAG: hypothetical protein IH611_06695 [Deltaproteobacteria bacterium]|nr:hypothetical protein [Deltaproteobacteria bacterium]
MDSLSIMHIALAVSALILAIGVTYALLGIRRSVEQLTQRLDETLRQVEMTTEEMRRTHTAVRGVVSGLDLAVSNVTHFTEGIRTLRGPVDLVMKVLDHSVSPTLVGLSGGIAGIKAAASHILHRFAGKEGTR